MCLDSNNTILDAVVVAQPRDREVAVISKPAHARTGVTPRVKAASDDRMIRLQTETGSVAYSSLAIKTAFELNRVGCLHQLLHQVVLGDYWRGGRRRGVFSGDVFCCSIRAGIASIVGLVFEYAGELLCRNIKNLRQIKIDFGVFSI